MMKKHLTALALSISLSGCAQAPAPHDEELIRHVLEHNYVDRGFVVLDPLTTLSDLTEDPSGRQALWRDELKVELARAGFAAGWLVDELYRKNANPVHLALNSNLEQHYAVDHSRSFLLHFTSQDSLRGWNQWRAENPTAQGLVQVSLPAFEPGTGLILVYIGVQRHLDDGEGRIELYRYRSGKFEKLWETVLWLS